MKIIALEEHTVPAFVLQALIASVDHQDGSLALNTPDLYDKLADLGEDRISDMRGSGVDVQVLSLPAPALNNFRADEAVALAADFNDLLASAIHLHPESFDGFATLPVAAPAASAYELERAVKQLGLKGALLSGRVRERNLDHAGFEPIYEAAAALGCPLYIHPQMPPQPVIDSYYAGFSAKADLILATGAVGWHYETGIQLLRLILSGVFDRHPQLQMITGHWGEVVLFYLERIELLERAQLGLQRPIKDYFRQNLFYTPSGIYSQQYLQRTVDIVGVERIMFSQDYPYHPAMGGAARSFLTDSGLSEADQARIGHENWETLIAPLSK